MSLLDNILQAAGGNAVKELAGKFNLGDSQIQDVIKQLTPALAQGLQKNARSPGGLESLLGALQKGNHQRYADNPASLKEASAEADGNGILGHILGSKDLSRQLASRAAEKTGVSDSLIKQMLPLVASLAMGSLAKQGLQDKVSTGESAKLGGLLSGILDTDKNSSILDDALGLAGKLFKR